MSATPRRQPPSRQPPSSQQPARPPALSAMVVGDVHIDHGGWAGPGGTGKAAWASATACWAAAIDAALERNVDVFCLAGDAFKDHRPPAEAVELIADGIRALARAGIPSVIIPGNHECHGLPAGHRHALDRLADIDAAQVVDEPAVVCFENGMQVACVPWPRRGGERARLGVAALEIEAALSHQVGGDVERLAEAVRPDQPSLFIGHLLADTVRFGGRALRGSEVAMAANLVEPVVSVAQLDEACFSMSVLAHVHRRQTLCASERVWYTGSTDAHDISDEGQGKAASLVRFDAAGTASMEPVALPARRFATLDVNLDAPERFAATVASVRPGDLVRVRWSGGDRMKLASLTAAIEKAGAAAVTTAAPPPPAPVRRVGESLGAEVGVTEALRSWAERAGHEAGYTETLVAAAEKIIAEVGGR